MTTQAVDIPLAQGLSQQVDPKLMPAGVLKRAENIRLRKDMRWGKRFGSYQVTGPSGTIAQLFSSGEQSLALTTAGRLHSRYGAASWADVGLAEAWVPLRSRIGMGGVSFGDVLNCGSAYVNGYVCIVYALQLNASSSLDIRAVILRADNGVVVSETLLANETSPATIGLVRVAVLDSTRFVAVWQRNSVNFRHRVFDTAAIGSGWGAPVTPAATITHTSPLTVGFDIDDDAGSGNYLLVWMTSTSQVTVGRINTTTGSTVASQNIGAIGVDDHLPTVAHCTERIYVAWTSPTATTVKATSCNTALSSTAAVVTLDDDATLRPGICRISATQAQVFWGFLTPVGSLRSVSTATVTDASVGGTPVNHYNLSMASKPFFANGAPHIWCTSSMPADAQKTYQLLTPQSSSGVAPTLLSLAEAEARIMDNASSKVYATAEGYAWTPLVRSSFEDSSGVAADRPVLFEFARDTQRQAVQVNGCLYIASGSLSIYDSKSVFDLGFSAYPYITGAAQAAGGSLTVTSTYQYVVVFEYLDAKGQIHRSQPSDPFEVVLTGVNQQVTLSVLGLSLHRKYLNAIAHVYRTLANDTVFFRVTSEATAPQAYAQTITYNDQASDASISVNPVLYVQGGPLPHFTPPACRYIATSGARVAIAGLSDETEVLVSKIVVPEEPVQFADHDAFRIRAPDAVTAIHYLDDVLVVFTGDSVYLVGGDGPDDSGNGVFSEPRRLPSIGGCIGWRSVLEIPAGLVFQGERGLYLLPRGFGAPVLVQGVEDEIAAYPVVTSASLTQTGSESLARWTVQNAAGNAGRVLTLDLRSNQWSVDSYYGAAIDCAATWSDGWAAVNASGVLFHESDATVASPYGDYVAPADDYVSSVLELGDLRPFGLQGRGLVRRVNVLGELRATPCAIKLEASYDGGLTYPDSAQWELSGSSGSQVARQWAIPRITIDEVRFRLSDLNSAGSDEGSSEGFVFNALTLEVEPRRGARRYASGDRA